MALSIMQLEVGGVGGDGGRVTLAVRARAGSFPGRMVWSLLVEATCDKNIGRRTLNFLQTGSFDVRLVLPRENLLHPRARH
jgi:hypothetical protein